MVLFNRLYLLLFFIKPIEILRLCLVIRTIARTWIWNQNKVHFKRYQVVSTEKWISIWQLVPFPSRHFRSPGKHLQESGYVMTTLHDYISSLFCKIEVGDRNLYIPTHMSSKVIQQGSDIQTKNNVLILIYDDDIEYKWVKKCFLNNNRYYSFKGISIQR